MWKAFVLTLIPSGMSTSDIILASIAGALLPGFNRCHGIFIARDNAQIAQLPAEHHIQRRAMQLCVIEGKLESTA